jgi:integrase/recombinase XerD
VTQLRKMMLEELQRRNYAETTTRHYIQTLEDFAQRFNCPPDRLGPRHIREYQAELFQKRKLSPNSVIRHLAALRFLPKLLIRNGCFICQRFLARKKLHNSSTQL